MASVRSLDNALLTGAGSPRPGFPITDNDGVTQIPTNGRLIRNLIEGADVVMSHLTHFYQLTALDFVDATNLGPFFNPSYTANGTAMIAGTQGMPNGQSVVSNYVDSLVVRRWAATMGGVFSGRQPIQNAIVPGGVTTVPNRSDMATFNQLLNNIRGFINTAYIPDVLTVAATAPVTLGGVYTTYLQYWNTTGTLNTLSYGMFPCQTGTAAEQLLIARGVCLGTAFQAGTGAGPTALLNNIFEDTTYSYYNNTAQLLPPHQGQTNPDVTKVGNGTQYTWLKAPRYSTARTVCEVGPLARMVVSTFNSACIAKIATQVGASQSSATFAGLPALYSASDIVGATLSAMVALTGGILTTVNLFSTFGRHAARAIECKLIADSMATWSSQLSANGLTNSTYVYAKLPTKPAFGSGWTEAPRGALGHWITIEKKKIVNYQCVVPSTWNHSPRDANNIKGPAETVISQINVGTASSDEQVVNIIRALHPFDFCIACAVHMVRPDGSTIAKFKMDMDGKVTKLPHDAEI